MSSYDFQKQYQSDPKFKVKSDNFFKNLGDVSDLDKIRAENYVTDAFYNGNNKMNTDHREKIDNKKYVELPESEKNKDDFSMLNTLKNLPSSTWNLAKAAGGMVFDVADFGDFTQDGFDFNLQENTVANVAKLGLGTLINTDEVITGAAKKVIGGGINKVFGTDFDTKQDTKVFGKFGQESEKLASAVGEFYAKNYGSVDGFLDYVEENPAGFLSDVSTAFSGVGAVTKGVGNITKIAALQNAGQKMAIAGIKAEPLYIASKLATKGIKMSMKASGNVAAMALGISTGTGKEAIKAAWKSRSPEFVKAMRGATSTDNILDAAKTSFHTLKEDASTAYKSKLEKIRLDKNIFSNDFVNVVSDLTDEIVDWRIGVQKKGNKFVYDFKNAGIADPTDIAKITNTIEMVRTWDDVTPAGLDALKKNLDDFYSSSSSRANAFSAKMSNKVRNILETKVKGYKEMTKPYAEAQAMIKELESAFSLKNTASSDTAIRKLSSIMRENFTYRNKLIKNLEQKTGVPLTDMIAGNQLSTLEPKGLIRVLAAGGIGGSVASGNFAPILLLPLASPRVVGELVRAMGYPAKKTQELINLITNKAGTKSNFANRINEFSDDTFNGFYESNTVQKNNIQLQQPVTRDMQKTSIANVADDLDNVNMPSNSLPDNTPLNQVDNIPSQTLDPKLQKKFPTLTPEEIMNLTPEERAAGLLGGGGDNMPRTAKTDSIKTSIQQAKASGQSFDDWVKGQGEPVYHGGNIEDITDFDPLKKFGDSKNDPLSNLGINLGDKNTAEYFSARKGGKILEVYTAPKKVKKTTYNSLLNEVADEMENVSGIKYGKQIRELKTTNAKNEFLIDNQSDPAITKMIADRYREQGYDLIEYKNTIDGGTSYIPLTKEVIKTKAQLKAEWDNMPRTATTTTDLATEARKYKNAEEFSNKVITREVPNELSEGTRNVPYYNLDSYGIVSPNEFIRSQEYLNQKIVNQYVKDIKSGKDLKPVVASYDQLGRLSITDGHHRAEAARIMNKDIPVFVEKLYKNSVANPNHQLTKLTDIWKQANKK